MARMPLTARALMLVPAFAVLADQLRVSAFCDGGARTCLASAGGGMLGPAGLAVLGAYAVLLALVVVRLRGSRVRSPSLLRLWGVSTTGLAAVCGGQALLAGALGDGSSLGGGWLELLALCAVAGGALAAALRSVPSALALMRRLRPSAPRVRLVACVAGHRVDGIERPNSRLCGLTAAGRAPPSTVG